MIRLKVFQPWIERTEKVSKGFWTVGSEVDVDGEEEERKEERRQSSPHGEEEKGKKRGERRKGV